MNASDVHNLRLLADLRQQIEDWKASMDHEPFHLGAITEVLNVLSSIVDGQSTHAHAVGGIAQVISDWKGTASIAALHHVTGIGERCTETSGALGAALGALHGMHQTVASLEVDKKQIIAQSLSRLDSTSPTSDADIASTRLFIEDSLFQLESLRALQHAELATLGQELAGVAIRADRLPPARVGSVVNPHTAFEHLIAEFHLKGLALRDVRGSHARAAVWSLSQEIAALAALGSVPGERAYAKKELGKLLRMLAPYWDKKRGAYLPYPMGRGKNPGTAFYDDNAWLGIDLVNAYSITGNRSQLQRAREIMKFERTGWDRHGGGMFWNDAHTKISAAASGGAAQLALELAHHTGNHADLAWGTHAYDWIRHHMTAPHSPLIVDGGDHHVWSYNQGLMVGNAALLYQITGKPAYLHQGIHLADAALRHFGTFAAQPSKFNAIFFKNLGHLNAVLPAPDPRYSAAVVNFADLRQGMHSGSLIQQSGFVQAQAYASTPLHAFAGK